MDPLEELSEARLAEYCAVKVLVGPALLKAVVDQYERYRAI
jgi:hypothetical protein